MKGIIKVVPGKFANSSLLNFQLENILKFHLVEIRMKYSPYRSFNIH